MEKRSKGGCVNFTLQISSMRRRGRGSKSWKNLHMSFMEAPQHEKGALSSCKAAKAPLVSTCRGACSAVPGNRSPPAAVRVGGEEDEDDPPDDPTDKRHRSSSIKEEEAHSGAGGGVSVLEVGSFLLRWQGERGEREVGGPLQGSRVPGR